MLGHLPHSLPLSLSLPPPQPAIATTSSFLSSSLPSSSLALLLFSLCYNFIFLKFQSSSLHYVAVASVVCCRCPPLQVSRMLRVQTYIWAYHFGLLQGNSTSFCSNLDSSSGNGHSCPSLEYLRLFQRQQKAQEMQIVAGKFFLFSCS